MPFTPEHAAQLVQAIRVFLEVAGPFRGISLPDEAAWLAVLRRDDWKRVEGAAGTVAALAEAWGLDSALRLVTGPTLLDLLQREPPDCLERLRGLHDMATIAAENRGPRTLREVATCMDPRWNNSSVVREQFARAVPERATLERIARGLHNDHGDLTDVRVATDLADALINNHFVGEADARDMLLPEVVEQLRPASQALRPHWISATEAARLSESAAVGYPLTVQQISKRAQQRPRPFRFRKQKGNRLDVDRQDFLGYCLIMKIEREGTRQDREPDEAEQQAIAERMHTERARRKEKEGR